VIRFGFLLVLLLMAPARAETVAPPAPEFAQKLAADVFATALAFMAPRILDPVPIGQLTAWGLRGLSALDPRLSTELSGGRLRLSAPDGLLFAAPAPDAADAQAWGEAAAEMAGAAWGESEPLRRAGTQGVIDNFFDELFNHLDPYSRYVPPAEAEADRARRSSEAGIGLTVALRAGALVAADVTAGGPAAAAGIRPGDQILAVDRQPLRDRDPLQAAALLSGAENSRVVLTVRAPNGRAREAAVVRAVLPAETVFAERQADMLVLRLTGFTHATGHGVEHGLRRGLSGPRHPRGIVFDLRGNRGGLLYQAVAVSAAVLGTGLVVTTVGRDPAADRVLQADATDLSGGLPVVVVVDGRSASAAEIVAAALADNRRAVVVGSVTTGKGLIQTVAPLPDGGELFVTWSRVLAPLGWPIQGFGVMPQVCTSLGEAALRAQLEDLAQGQEPMQKALALSRTAREPMPPAQILDMRNACPAAEGREADLEAARFLIDNPDAYAAALLPAQLLPSRASAAH